MENHHSDLIDLDAYFERIGYSGDRSPTLQTLQAIHQCHVEAIAYENLNSFLKQPVRLDIKSVQQKLIHEGRGGYCFEQNSLLRIVLITLGFQITNLAARVLWNRPEGITTPLTHMILQVDLEGEPYIADVGFGGITPTAPLQLKPDFKQPTSREPFRLLKTDDAYTLQVLLGHEWRALYRFNLHVQHLIDYEVSNWYVSTHPDSLFVNSLIVTRPGINCRYTLLNNQLTTYYLDGRAERQVLKTVDALWATLEDVIGVRLSTIAGLDEALQRLIEPTSNL